MRKIFLLIGLLLAYGNGWANSEEAKPDESAGPAIEYLEMKPKFTVNLAEPKRYLMVNVQLLVEGAANAEKIKKVMPMLKHEMIMALSGMHAADIQTMEQREALRVKSTQLISDLLGKAQIGDGFKEVFFSEFLVQ